MSPAELSEEVTAEDHPVLTITAPRTVHAPPVDAPPVDAPHVEIPAPARRKPDKQARAAAKAAKQARKAKHGPGVGDPDAPIGVFDSGVGGLTVARSIIDQLPDESILYVGDTARGPYGPRPIAQVRAFALDVMDHLVDSGVKALVIACNSASAAVLRDARERYPVPVVEVIKPAVRRAVRATNNGNVGVIGTVATVTSGAYDDAFAAAPDLRVFSQACPRFVEFVEAGITTGQEVIEVAHGYLDPLLDLKIDTLVLGCTHYPLLTGAISYVCGEDVTLVSSAEETAKDVYRTLAAHGLDRGWSGPRPSYRFLATGDPEPFARLGRRFLGPEVRSVKQTPHWVAAQ